jgi:signal transduction histidine kinase
MHKKNIVLPLKTNAMSTENNDIRVKKILLRQNLRRMRYGSVAGILVTLAHIIYFFSDLAEAGTVKYTWQVGLIISHAFLLTIFVFNSIFIAIPQKHHKITERSGWLFLFITNIGLLLGGVAITVIDQLVISAITPFIILSFAVALIYLLPPIKSILLFSLAFAVLFFTLPITQHDPDILLSLRINAFSITVISILLSIVLWRTNKTNYRQALIIDTQKQELEQANAELQEQARKLSETNETKDKFFSIIAHDLKSPFNAVMGFSDLLADQLREKNYDGIKKHVDYVQQSSHLAMDLLNNLMDWARSQTGKMSFQPEHLNMLAIANETMAFFADTTRKKSITIAAHIADPPTVFADNKMLSSILHNLISNAIKFTPAGGKVLIKSEKRAGETLISVSDNGIGMSNTMLQNLFSIDKNTNRQGTEGEPSTGLGLYLCKEFVENHNGKIWAEAKENKGSTFYFSLPSKEV